jgi:hypothetical protein
MPHVPDGLTIVPTRRSAERQGAKDYGQVERMNRTIKEATVRRFYYDIHERLRAHLATFLEAYSYAKRLKTLQGLTPFEYICKIWSEQPQRFRLNPIHHMAGPNI